MSKINEIKSNTSKNFWRENLNSSGAVTGGVVQWEEVLDSSKTQSKTISTATNTAGKIEDLSETSGGKSIEYEIQKSTKFDEIVKSDEQYRDAKGNHELLIKTKKEPNVNYTGWYVSRNSFFSTYTINVVIDGKLVAHSGYDKRTKKEAFEIKKMKSTENPSVTYHRGSLKHDKWLLERWSDYAIATNTKTANLYKIKVVEVEGKVCSHWANNPGITNHKGKETNDYIITVYNLNQFTCTVNAVDNRKWGVYTIEDAVTVLRGIFHKKDCKKYKYFVFHGTKGTYLGSENFRVWGYETLSEAKSAVIKEKDSIDVRMITFGFCQDGAEEGTSDWQNEPNYLVNEPCESFSGNAGLDTTFLKGQNYELIDTTILATPKVDSLFDPVVFGRGTFKDDLTPVSNVLADHSFEVIRDYLFHTTSKFNWISGGYKYFFIAPDPSQGTGKQHILVFGAPTIEELQKVSIAPFIGKTCYSFGYCDSRPGFSTGSSTAAPPPPPKPEIKEVEFSNQISGEKSKRKILRIIDEIILGNAFAVSPELVPNMDWAWKAAGKIQNAMAVTSGAFFNYLGHYIAPDGALREPFGLGFGPFANDLIKSVDNVETSSPAPLSFGGLEPKEDTNKRVVRYVASSRLNGAIARAKAAPSKAIPPGATATQRANLNPYAIRPKANKSEPMFTGVNEIFTPEGLKTPPTGAAGGIPAVSYSMKKLFEDYDVDSANGMLQLIPCTSKDWRYNRDLHEDFQKFDPYTWEGKWGDENDRFQTAVEFKITIKANNDRGKSDAGISLSGLNERATNDTECWGKIWIGDTKDYEKTDASAKITNSFLHQTGSYPLVYEFYNPHFSTGKITFGNGAKSTRTFLVRIDRKPHEEGLTIFTKGYIKGNRRGELSPKSFIPEAGKIFDFAATICGAMSFGGIFPIDVTILGNRILVDPFGWVCDAMKGVEDALNNMFSFVTNIVNELINAIVNGIFGFMFALMNESYRETYHSTIEFEVEENKVYESKFETEDVERHPAKRYFDSMEAEKAYLYTQYHFPFADLNRFKVYGKKYYPTIPFMGNELVKGRSLSNTRVYKKNRYCVANLFRLTYETNIGVIYEYLLRQNDIASPSTEIDYNIKLSGRKTVEKSDALIEKQKPCVFDLILPSDLNNIADLVKEQGGGLGTKSCYDGDFDSLISDAAVPAKLDSSNKTKRLTVAGYADVYSKYGNKIDPNGTSGNARIAEINKIIGEFSDIESKLGKIDSDGYKLSTWTAHCAAEFVGLGVNMTAPNTNSLIGYIQGAPGATAKTPPTYSVTVGGTTLTGTVKKDAPATNPKTWDWGSLTSTQIAQTNFPAFNETTYTIVTAPSYTKDGIQYDYNTPNPGWNINMTASTATPRNLVYKIIEFILWYVQPNGIAQTTRLSASALYEYEKLMQADIDAYDPTGTEDPNKKEPIIINGELYERRC